MNSNNLVVYTTHCPQCKVLINLLDNKGISYDVIDNIDNVMAAAQAAGLSTVPFCQVPGEEKMKTFPEMIKYINSL